MLRGVAAIDQHWGSRIRTARTDRGLTIAQLAYRSDINPGNLSRIERGLERPGDETRMRIAAALDARVEDIWTYPVEVAS